MTATQTEMLTLTREDIAALKKASSVSFHLNGHSGPIIRAHREANSFEDPTRFTAEQKRLYPTLDAFSNADGTYAQRLRDIVVTANIQTTSWNPTSSEDKPNVGFAMIHSSHWSTGWQSIVHVLKPEDRLHLRFHADRYSNEITKKVNVHTDCLVLLIERVERGQKVTLEFTVTVQTSLDNTARMVRLVRDSSYYR